MSRVLPILFNTEMVRAILDGEKTVTRRLVKPQPEVDNIGLFHWKCFSDIVGVNELRFKLSKSKHAPYQPGDILYVRETWNETTHGYNYKASPLGNSRDTYPWRPSIHMPKEAARIWLKVTDVRVERLKNISEQQASNEGVQSPYSYADNDDYWEVTGRNELPASVAAFSVLWDSTIKKFEFELARHGWEANPWVWVVEFIKIDKQEEKYHAE